MFHSSIRSLLCLCSLMIAGARQVWLPHAKILSRVPMFFSGRGVPGKIPLVYLAVFAAAWQWGALPCDKLSGTAFADPVVHVLSGPGEQLIIENDGKVHLAYGTTGNNQVTVESGAKAHLRHFPGENRIHIAAEMAQCVAVRSGAMVTIENPNDGTLMKIPATNEKQTLQFASYSKILQIIGGKVKLGDLEIGLDAQPIVQGPPPVVTSTIPANGAENVGVNTSIAIHFSKPMWGASLMLDYFILKKLSDPSEEPILCSMTIESTSVILTPMETLAYNTEYQLTVMTWVQDTSGNHLAEEKVVTFTTRGIPPISYETIPPVVQSTIPANGETGVDVDNPITIVFSEQMSLHTLIPENFRLGKSRKVGHISYYEPVPFTLTLGFLGTSVTLTPNEPLAYHKKHRLKVKTGVQDKVGNPMEEEYVITFTTGADTKPPFVVSTTPADGAEGVGVNTSITIQFNEPMDQSTLIPENFRLSQRTVVGGPIGDGYSPLPSSAYTITKTPTSVTLTLNKPLLYDTKYKVSFAGIKDIAGNNIVAGHFDFTTEKPQPGDEITINLGDGVDMTFVWVPEGSFYMGSIDNEPHSQSHERPRHLVTLTQGFWMGKYEVTQEQWLHIMGNNPSHFQGDNLPVENVSWNDAQQLITELNIHRWETFSLPTEAQWEYAARGGVPDHIYSGSNACALVGWYNVTSQGHTRMVGMLGSNDWGLKDMSGNVWEFCQDWYGDYPFGAVTDPTGPVSGKNHIIRGGSWYNDDSSLRSACRGVSPPDGANSLMGFRLVMHLP